MSSTMLANNKPPNAIVYAVSFLPIVRVSYFGSSNEPGILTGVSSSLE